MASNLFAIVVRKYMIVLYSDDDVEVNLFNSGIINLLVIFRREKNMVIQFRR